MKRIFLSLMLLMIPSVACADNKKSESEWRSSVEDFELKTIQLEKGRHVVLAVADKPIMCAMYRNGEAIMEAHSENNACFIKFESQQKETLVFFVIYNLKQNEKTVAFKYHATVI